MLYPLDETNNDPTQRQRLLEGWLPLAAEASQFYGWNLAAVALETLILEAAPNLRQVRTSLEARAVLWSAYQRRQQEHGP